jgi:hypothetical protein
MTHAGGGCTRHTQVSYMKAIDVWMGVCMTFVFGVMIEFTVCHFARNRREKVCAFWT